ncbi:DNA mismatch repair protein PMS1-like [Abeliophyllum distichum]|uniref:DNA mismatch repair protein PMS1-like n=1 Tax=Abeliophyllum distichum TaxID=126358 RepID=A0ABD1UFT1_9LAMI
MSSWLSLCLSLLGQLQFQQSITFLKFIHHIHPSLSSGLRCWYSASVTEAHKHNIAKHITGTQFRVCRYGFGRGKLVRKFTKLSQWLDICRSTFPNVESIVEPKLSSPALQTICTYNTIGELIKLVIGQFNLGFIIGKLDQDLFIVDQHDADEKYNYERLSQSTIMNQQPLLWPLEMELSPEEEIVIYMHLDTIKCGIYKNLFCSFIVPLICHS